MVPSRTNPSFSYMRIASSLYERRRGRRGRGSPRRTQTAGGDAAMQPLGSIPLAPIGLFSDSHRHLRRTVVPLHLEERGEPDEFAALRRTEPRTLDREQWLGGLAPPHGHRSAQLGSWPAIRQRSASAAAAPIASLPGAPCRAENGHHRRRRARASRHLDWTQQRSAFGLTIFSADQEDFYVYETNPANPNEYRYTGGWQAMVAQGQSIPVRVAPSTKAKTKATKRHRAA